ncbi:ABC transporter substrate-binding protein [Natrinema sp. 1APR25-10V2]|uniref:ABC transporter substrate-binding protein n=1 Tax=Natrinema sp. 1APR25-10V2 TaxID=2951081 RepID=UPI0028753149|nr:ABC transporter substrate-binding protein [Natrinema sp. 1APR25-10V2]MDS0476735.1 ABC transporter substrate-binding protein [Natrinema sp. 1APR25-10V2]
MFEDDSADGTATRREYVKYGSAVLAGGVLAGCAGDRGSDGSESTDSESYSVSMEPMGTVSFDSVPETWMAYFSNYGDMGIALGQLDGLQGLIFTENWPLTFFDHLPGVDVSFDDVPQLMGEGSIPKESFYELNCDVHLMDPNFISLLDDNWDEGDYDEIRNSLGPIVGNTIRRRGEDWHDYPYYSLYEAFGKIAEVFQQQERYEAITQIHDGLLDDVQSQLPDEEERPTVGLLSVNSDFEEGSFYAYPVNDGNGHKQYRDLGMRGAFDDVIEGGYAEWDYEQLLEVDPDALVFQYGFSHVSTEEFERRMDAMRDDSVGKQLTAVQNDRLYRGGTSYQGPLINLFQTEAAAKQFYPDTFGEWEGIDTLAKPDARLFDYQAVADIINGDF